MMIRKARIISLVVLLLSFSSCSPSALNDSENLSESSFSSESSTSSEGEHPVQDINFFVISINIKRGDYAWYRFENHFESQAFGVVITDYTGPICLEPYHEQVLGFSPENRKDIALSGTIDVDDGTAYYTFYDFYLPHGEDIYFRVSPAEPRFVQSVLNFGKLEAIKDFFVDGKGNHYLSDLHVHELTFYSYDPGDQDHNPLFGHYHICWKGDLSVFEEHEFGSPYTGFDGKTYVSCLKCQFIQEVLFKDSSSDN